MVANRLTKIHIIGSVGSGKTTLAKFLSSKWQVPYHELDNIVWERHESGDRRRTAEERDAYLNKIIQTEKWIIEGVHHEWVLPSFQHAEAILFLDTPYSKRTYRITKRFILQKIGREQSNYKPTLKIFRKMFGWNSYFESVSKTEIFKMLLPYKEKVIVLKNNDWRYWGGRE